MGTHKGNDSSANNFIWVLALEAPRVKEKKPEETSSKKKPEETSSKKKPEETHRDILTIDQGQDIREEVLNYFRKSTSNSENYNGCKRMGSILSATGSVLHPKSNGDSYKIKYLSGRFIISEDGRVEQYESWTISCVGSSCLVITDEVNGSLIAAEPVQVTVGTFPIYPSR